MNGSEVGFYGGSVQLADYCPYKQEFTWKFNDIVIRGSQCSFVENSPNSDKNFALEHYGENSKCFYNKEMWQERTCFHLRQWGHYGSSCSKVSLVIHIFLIIILILIVNFQI